MSRISVISADICEEEMWTAVEQELKAQDSFGLVLNKFFAIPSDIIMNKGYNQKYFHFITIWI